MVRLFQVNILFCITSVLVSCAEQNRESNLQAQPQDTYVFDSVDGVAVLDVGPCTSHMISSNIYYGKTGSGSRQEKGAAVVNSIILQGSFGTIRDEGKSLLSSLKNVRYFDSAGFENCMFELDQPINGYGQLPGEAELAKAIQNYFKNDCKHLIVADTQFGSRTGRVIWCTQGSMAGSAYKGLHWNWGIEEKVQISEQAGPRMSWDGIWK